MLSKKDILRLGSMIPLSLVWYVICKVFFADETVTMVIIQVSLLAMQIACCFLLDRERKRERKRL